MRFAVLAAAVTALCAQPAQALTYVTFHVDAYIPVTEEIIQEYQTYNREYIERFSGQVEGSSDDGVNFTFRDDSSPFYGTVYGKALYLGDYSFQGLEINYVLYQRYAPDYIINISGATNRFGISLVSPPPAVPEPATWAMMLAGFAAIGTGLRRRKPKVSYGFRTEVLPAS